MRIVIVVTHQWPLPSPAHTGPIVCLDLARALVDMGNDVQMCVPEPTEFPNVLPMMCANGTAHPSAAECEQRALAEHRAAFDACDVIHDFSCEKTFAEAYPDKTVSTHFSGNFDRPLHGRNGVVWSEEMRGRALRGASDYEGTGFTQWARDSRPLKDARVVAGGVDTEFWCPGGERSDHVLWLGRWHEARGYRLAIDVARHDPSLSLVMCGESAGDATNQHQASCAMDAVNYASGLSNVRFEWLPKERHREAVREQYRRARGYIFCPQFQEPFGLSQVEALACGTPVIGTRMGSVPEVVEHGRTGWVVTSDVDAIASACRMVERIDPDVCRKEAVRRFDRSVMAANYVRAYQECLAGGWG